MSDRRRTALLLAHSFPPISTGGVFRILRFVKYLPENGWQPVVIASPTKHGAVLRDEGLLRQVPPSTIVHRPPMPNPEAWVGRLLRSLRPDGTPSGSAASSASPAAGISETRTPSAGRHMREWLGKLQELLFRTPDENVWWVAPAVRAGLRAIRQTDPDVIYTTGPPHSTHLAGLVLRLITGLPWVADFRDPWSRQPWGQKRNLWGARLLPFIEAECVRNASCVILNTNRMAGDFRQHYHYCRQSKFIALSNGFDPELKRIVDECRRGASVTHRSGEPLRLCHPGSLYHKRDLRPFIDAIRLLADEEFPVRFENFGDCPARSELQAYVRELGLEHAIVFEDPVAHHEALRRMARSDVLMLIQPNNEMQVPGKLYEMMLFGTPILSVTDDGEVTDIVRRYELGEVARSSDAQEMARAIRRLGERCRREPTAAANPAALEAFNGRSLSARLADAFESVVRDFGRQAAAPGLSAGGGHDIERPEQDGKETEMPYEDFLRPKGSHVLVTEADQSL